MNEITEQLKAWNKGDPKALDRLLPLVDRELKIIAHNYMRNERPGNILQTTALVNEALIKLIQENISWENRKQFYVLVAKRMRQVLIDYAKKQKAAKRGKRVEHVDVSEAEDQSAEKSQELVRLGEALAALAKIEERKATVVECRFFIGLTFREIAELLGVSQSTVEGEWRFARAWLKRELSADSVSE